jgi:NTP pyrophosphatase (non-canonical NTP hydrolase)
VNLQDFQKRTETILAPVAHPRVLSVLALVEETGELAKLVLDHEGYGQPLDPVKLSGEIADIAVALAEVSTRHGVDLEKACSEKLADLEKRVPGWVGKFGPALEKARRRFD